MPRPPRAFHAGIYHLGSHGSDQPHLFLSDQERAAFLERLGLVLKRFELGLVAYTLMGNHYHLLRVPDARVSKALQLLHTWYARLHNKLHGAVRTCSGRISSSEKSKATRTCSAHAAT